jgi:hypothetical protein
VNPGWTVNQERGQGLGPAPRDTGKPALRVALAQEDPVKTYKVIPVNLIFLYTLLGFVTLVGAYAGYQGFMQPEAPAAVSLIGIVWFGVLAWIWYFYLRIPVAITWRDEGVLEFKSLIRTIAVPVSDIIAIKAVPLSWGFIKIVYNGGSLKLLNQITGLYELIGAVKAANPQVEITGC